MINEKEIEIIILEEIQRKTFPFNWDLKDTNMGKICYIPTQEQIHNPMELIVQNTDELRVTIDGVISIIIFPLNKEKIFEKAINFISGFLNNRYYVKRYSVLGCWIKSELIGENKEVLYTHSSLFAFLEWLKFVGVKPKLTVK